jgi:protein-L-isoaspartate(D-aspartate) O-methyltransferase
MAAVYHDEPYPTKLDQHGDAISSSSQPGIMASMLEELRLSPGQRVLEIGAGTGYNAALLSLLVGPRGRVTSVELDPEVAREARRALRTIGRRGRIVTGDGRQGWEEGAPYDRIILTASSLDVPHALVQQLTADGLLVMPLRLSDAVPFRQVVVTFQRVGHRLRSVSVIHGGFMRLRAHVDDPSLPWPMTEAVETREGVRKVIASLSGSTLNTLSSRERAALLALMLSQRRSRSIGLRVRGHAHWALEAFLCLAVPEELLVGCTRTDLAHLLFYSTAMPGVIDKERRSLAHLGGGKTISRIDSYGGRRAEEALQRLVDEWLRRGRPDVSRLRVEVAYGPSAPRRAWRSRRRGSNVLLFDWV